MKFVGKNAVVEGNGVVLVVVVVLVLSRERRRRSSSGRARRMVKDFTINWPPNRRPFTSEVGLKEKSDDVVVFFVVWSFGCWCFCFLFFFFSFSDPIDGGVVVVDGGCSGGDSGGRYNMFGI